MKTLLGASFTRIAAAAILCILLGSVAAASDVLPRRGILGVGTADTNGAVTITAVLPSLPGATAGLQRGDVITSVDGVPVANNADFLKKLRRPGGQAVELGIMRAGTAMTVRVVLLEAPKEHDPAVDTGRP
jgi:S1-C subfamily serine protease